MDSYALDDDLNLIPIEWDDPRNLIGNEEDWERERRMAKTEFTSGTNVSTVFLGTDHNHGDDGDPVVFETMVFDDNGTDMEEMIRYSTFDRAIAGHEATVEKMIERYGLTIKSSYIKEGPVQPPEPPRKLEYSNETNESILKRRFTKRIKT